MKRGREMVLTVALISAFVLMLLPLSSAGFFSDVWNKITGQATGGVSLNISVGAIAIVTVWNASMVPSGSETLNAGPGATYITVNFTASHGAGFASINVSTADVNFTRSSEQTRYNESCSNTSGWTNYMNFSCNVTMWWFDSPGTWTINASIKDTNGNFISNASTTFQVAETTGFNMGPTNLSWSSISPGSTNQTSSNDPLTLNNTGNHNISIGNISVNATSLIGETTPGQALYAGNFSVSWTTGGACSGAACLECAGTQMANITYVNVTTANLTRGNYTINDGNQGQEQLYFCLRYAGTELSAQAYSTKATGAWIVQI